MDRYNSVRAPASSVSCTGAADLRDSASEHIFCYQRRSCPRVAGAALPVNLIAVWEVDLLKVWLLGDFGWIYIAAEFVVTDERVCATAVKAFEVSNQNSDLDLVTEEVSCSL